MVKLRDIYESDYSIFNQPRRKLVRVEQPSSRQVILELYRGFDADLEDIESTDDGKLILSPAKGEQGLLWFTHRLIGHHDPVEYAKAHGEWLLIYPLPCTRHFTRHWYDDGDYYDAIPEEIAAKTNALENCKYYMGIELPDGWVFSYKSQKFIGCGLDLMVGIDMISRV